MPRKKRKTGIAGALLTVALLALAAFAIGEGWMLLHHGGGAPAWLGGRRRADVERSMAEQIRRGLTAAEVPPDSVTQHDAGIGKAPRQWRIGLRPDQSLLQTNYAITHYVEARGGTILSGRESSPERGVSEVRLELGLPHHPTDQLVLVRGAKTPNRPVPGSARLALVLFGLPPDPAAIRPFLELAAPFAVALPAGAPKSGQAFRAAHAASREVVVALPLEPVNYPQVDPGPGTLLVTMNPAEVTGITRRYLDQAAPLVAVSNHMGSLATQDMATMGAVFQELQRRNVPFVHLLPTAGAVCRSLAAKSGVVYAEPGAVLDAEARGSKSKQLEQRWAEILARTRERGRMTVWVRATPLTRSWLPHAVAPKRLAGVDLVPLSALLRKGANP